MKKIKWSHKYRLKNNRKQYEPIYYISIYIDYQCIRKKAHAYIYIRKLFKKK